MAKQKPEFVMAGKGKDGLPSVEDLIALYTKLTGKVPTPEEVQRLRDKRRNTGAG